MLSKQADAEYKKLLRHKWEYYTGKADASVYAQKPFNFKLLRQDVDQYIQSNEEYVFDEEEEIINLYISSKEYILLTTRFNIGNNPECI